MGVLIMIARFVITAAIVLVARPALAEPMSAAAAERFVVGKVFEYNCYDGTRGTGRIQSDLSVEGTIQIRGTGPIRFVTLPPGTLKVKDQSVCASLRGVPFEPCFNVLKTNSDSFRGSVQGFDFAFCDFTQSIQRRHSVLTSRPGRPRSQSSSIQLESTDPRGNDVSAPKQ
jgi:hypothetical protein